LLCYGVLEIVSFIISIINDYYNYYYYSYNKTTTTTTTVIGLQLQLAIWGRAQREADRRFTSDWGDNLRG